MKSQDDKKFIWFLIVITFILAGFIACVRLAHAETTENGKLNLKLLYETQGQKNWFVTASGTGDCSSWDRACTFRTAVAKCTDDLQDVIWLAPGAHDTDNGVDANGTDIDKDYVTIQGIPHKHLFSTQLVNSAASADYILKTTGSWITLVNLNLTNAAQTDKDLVANLWLSGGRVSLDTVKATFHATATTGDGILISGASMGYFLKHIHIEDSPESAIKINGASAVEGHEIYIDQCVTGIEFTGTNDDAEFHKIYFHDATQAINVGAGSTDINFDDVLFARCTGRVATAATYHQVHIYNFHITQSRQLTYPLNAGTTIAGGAAAYAQGNLTQIIPASTITGPFVITTVNLQAATASNTYKMELFFGESSGSVTSLGIYEFTVGTDFKGAFPTVNFGLIAGIIPANSYIGAKVASSSGGADEIVVTIGYEPL